VSNDLFNRELPTVETLPRQLALLEVKYDEFLPEIINDILQIVTVKNFQCQNTLFADVLLTK